MPRTYLVGEFGTSLLGGAPDGVDVIAPVNVGVVPSVPENDILGGIGAGLVVAQPLLRGFLILDVGEDGQWSITVVQASEADTAFTVTPVSVQQPVSVPQRRRAWWWAKARASFMG